MARRKVGPDATAAKPTRPARRTAQEAPSGAASPAAGVPSHEALAARAYALFLARGGQHGNDWADWLQAEAELRAEGDIPK